MNIQPIIDETRSDLQFQLEKLVKLGSQEMTSTVRANIAIQQINITIEHINRLQAKIETLEELK